MDLLAGFTAHYKLLLSVLCDIDQRVELSAALDFVCLNVLYSATDLAEDR